jgi:regulator of replication initiation timing
MATISREAIEWMQDELESKTSQIDELEEELAEALEENKALRLQITQLMSDRSFVG